MTIDEIWDRLIRLLGNPPIEVRPTTTSAELGYSATGWRTLVQVDVQDEFHVFLSPTGIDTVGQLALAIQQAQGHQHLAAMMPKNVAPGRAAAKPARRFRASIPFFAAKKTRHGR